jgi:hypothetical protein
MINLVESIRRNLQYPELHKVDPNTQDIRDHTRYPDIVQLGQAAIPAVLTGLYKLSRSNEGCVEIINAADTGDSLAVLFKGHESEVIEKVAHYAGVSNNEAESHLENIADETIRLVKQTAKDSPVVLKHLMSDQRHNILVCLPASLNMGDLLNDAQLDDKTNKMEGPVSNFMHKIENKFSQGGN